MLENLYMAQGTGYINTQRGDVVLTTRTGTTRNQPSSYKPFKLLKGVDTTITFFIKELDASPVQLHDKTIKAQITKNKDNTVLVSKNLKIADYDNGVVTLHVAPGDIASFDPAFYNILLTYTNPNNQIHAMHADQNYRYCYTAEVVDDCGPMDMGASSEIMASNLIYQEEVALSASVTYSGLTSALFASGSAMGNTHYTTDKFVYSGSGVNASLEIVKTNGNYTVSATNGGIGYSVGETITILGTFLGGESPTHDAVITIGTVSASGGITSLSAGGTPNFNSRSYITSPLAGSAMRTGACNGLNTISIQNSGFEGSFQLQGTLLTNPTTDNDWFTINPHGQTNIFGAINVNNTTNAQFTEAFTFDGNFMYIRIKFNIIKGSIDKLLYRS